MQMNAKWWISADRRTVRFEGEAQASDGRSFTEEQILALFADVPEALMGLTRLPDPIG